MYKAETLSLELQGFEGFSQALDRILHVREADDLVVVAAIDGLKALL